jgi:signal transduction histidine kinase
VRVPVAVEDGPVEAYYEILADITERKRAEAALRAYPRGLIDAQEAERRRMARELHDEIGQLLTSVTLMLSVSRTLPVEAAQARVGECQALVDDLIEKVRNLALDLRPAMLDELGLGPALLWLVKRHGDQTGIEIKLRQRGLEDRRFDPEIETAAYRIVQEALTNIARHAGVREATVRVWAREGSLEVDVEDQGVGFDRQATPSSGGSAGLAGMRERATLLGARLTIETAPGTGTRVSAEFPLGPRTEGGRL